MEKLGNFMVRIKKSYLRKKYKYFILAVLAIAIFIIMSYASTLHSVDNKNYINLYFLCGEENYYIEKISNHISNKILNDEEKSLAIRSLILSVMPIEDKPGSEHIRGFLIPRVFKTSDILFIAPFSK